MAQRYEEKLKYANKFTFFNIKKIFDSLTNIMLKNLHGSEIIATFVSDEECTFLSTHEE